MPTWDLSSLPAGAWPAPDACFQDVNMAGNTYGNCGKDSQGRYVKCDKRWVQRWHPWVPHVLLLYAQPPAAHPCRGAGRVLPQPPAITPWARSGLDLRMPPGSSSAQSPLLLGGCPTAHHLPTQPEGKIKDSISRRHYLEGVCSSVFPVRQGMLERPPLPIPSSISLHCP